MEIKLKLGEVLNLNQSLKLVIDDTETKVDSLFKFRLLSIMKSIESHISNFETIRNEKIQEYGEQGDDGNIFISVENKEVMKKFTDDLTELINSEVTVNIQKLKPEDVFDKGVRAEYLIGLYPIIEE